MHHPQYACHRVTLQGHFRAGVTFLPLRSQRRISTSLLKIWPALHPNNLFSQAVLLFQSLLSAAFVLYPRIIPAHVLFEYALFQQGYIVI